MDPPDPVVRGGDDEDDDDRPIRWVSVTPATAKRDSSVKLGKVGRLIHILKKPFKTSGELVLKTFLRSIIQLLCTLCSGSISEEVVSLCPQFLPLLAKGELIIRLDQPTKSLDREELHMIISIYLREGFRKKNRIFYGLLPNRARVVKKPYCFLKKYFFREHVESF